MKKGLTAGSRKTPRKVRVGEIFVVKKGKAYVGETEVFVPPGTGVFIQDKNKNAGTWEGTMAEHLGLPTSDPRFVEYRGKLIKINRRGSRRKVMRWDGQLVDLEAAGLGAEVWRMPRKGQYAP